QPARPALDLDQEKAHRAEDEEVDFIDTPVIGDELKVAPRSVRLVVRKLGAHELQRLAFPRVTRLSKLDPRRRFSHLALKPLRGTQPRSHGAAIEFNTAGRAADSLIQPAS